jgi:hypothetical protein
MDWHTRSDHEGGEAFCDASRYIADDDPPLSDMWRVAWKRVSVQREPMCSEDRNELNLMYYYFVRVSIDFTPEKSYFDLSGRARPEGYGLFIEDAGFDVSVMVCGHTIESAYLFAMRQIAVMMFGGLPVIRSRDDLRKCGL